MTSSWWRLRKFFQIHSREISPLLSFVASGFSLPALLKSISYQVNFASLAWSLPEAPECLNSLLGSAGEEGLAPFTGGCHLVSTPNSHVFPTLSCWSAPSPSIDSLPCGNSHNSQLGVSLFTVCWWGRFQLHLSWFILFNLYSHWLLCSPILLTISHLRGRKILKISFWVDPIVWLFSITTTYLKGKLKSEGSERFIVSTASVVFGAGKILERI